MARLEITPPLGPKELSAAVVGLINNPDGCIIPLDEFKRTLPISFRNKNFVVNWLKAKELLDVVRIEKCGTVKDSAVVAWTREGVKLKRKRSQEIEKILKNMNEGKRV